jgi:hypothetical protein
MAKKNSNKTDFMNFKNFINFKNLIRKSYIVNLKLFFIVIPSKRSDWYRFHQIQMN